MVFVTKGHMTKRKAMQGLTVLGVDLQDAREEIFVRLICDGISIGVAFARAGFTSKHQNAAHNLFNLPRVQERAGKILEARRTQGVVTLPQVTDMLQRVFAGAHMEGEYSAAHNAAFSLARIYGHVTDKSVIEHIRRPSRDPDAPSETALEAWAASLPVVSPLSSTPLEAPLDGAPAPLLGREPAELTAVNSSAGTFPYASQSTPSTEQLEQYQGLSNKDHLSDRPVLGENKAGWPADGPGGTGNGAPVGPVTGTPTACGHSGLLGESEKGTGTNWGAEEKTGPACREPVAMAAPRPAAPVVCRVPDRQDSDPAVIIPSFEQLFG